MSTDEQLVALHRRTTDPAHRAACPEAGELFSLLAGSATPAERDRLVDHVAGCTACAEEVRLMRSLRPWAEEAAGRLDAPRRPGTGGRGILLTLAAALLIAVLGAGVLLQRDLAAPPDAADLRRSATAERVSPAPEAVLRQPPAELAWPPQAGATGYRPRLFDEEANLLWEGAAGRGPKTAIPPEVRARLRPGASYFWVVDVEGTARRRQLGAYWFRLEGR